MTTDVELYTIKLAFGVPFIILINFVNFGVHAPDWYA